MVNEHHRHPLAQRFGGGTLSSSDGLRLPMRGKSLTARVLSRYFLHEGVTTYCHVSDQHSTYGTQVIVSTDRDGLYVLDEILGNTTELPIVEHTTDSHGQLLATFGLFDLVGKKLSPRIAKIADKPRWRPHPASHYAQWPVAGPLLRTHAQIDLIDEHWDELARIAGSLKGFAPRGGVQFTGLGSTFRCGVVANTIRVVGSSITSSSTKVAYPPQDIADSVCVPCRLGTPGDGSPWNRRWSDHESHHVRGTDEPTLWRRAQSRRTRIPVPRWPDREVHDPGWTALCDGAPVRAWRALRSRPRQQSCDGIHRQRYFFSGVHHLRTTGV